MVEIVTTSNGYPLFSEPGVDVATTNRFYLKGPGFVAVSFLGLDVHVNGDGIIIATEEFTTRTGLQPISLKISGVELAKEDKVYYLPSVPLDDGETHLTLIKDL